MAKDRTPSPERREAIRTPAPSCGRSRRAAPSAGELRLFARPRRAARRCPPPTPARLGARAKIRRLNSLLR
ncbi:hypothetical protein A8H32_08890 [Burkholderia thailandensis]|nr:hypothetical protein A8H32_08890 [Burkholderia thailandensis]TGB32807.1 hypothetical protein C6946_15625 [Burkholderia thailandensis]